MPCLYPANSNKTLKGKHDALMKRLDEVLT